MSKRSRCGAVRHAGHPGQGAAGAHAHHARQLPGRSNSQSSVASASFAVGGLPQQSDPTRTILAEGTSGSRQIRTAPQQERFDTQDLRRGFAKVKTNSHGATARALQHARSPQRVRRAQDKFARRHSESASTRTIPAEGSSGLRQIRCRPLRQKLAPGSDRSAASQLRLATL